MIVLITGATDGLGRGLARALDADGHTVLVHGRSEQRIADTLAELSRSRAQLPRRPRVARRGAPAGRRGARARAAAGRARQQRRHRRSDGGREESADGYELRFAVNYLAGFLLTRRLGDLPGRVVNVSSAGQAPIDFDDVMLERDYSGAQAYCQSKLAQILFTFDLADDGVTGRRAAPGDLHADEDGRVADQHARGGRRGDGAAGHRAGAEVTGRYFNGSARRARTHRRTTPTRGAHLRELSERLTGA